LAILPSFVVGSGTDVTNQTLVDDTLPPNKAGEDHGSSKTTAEEWKDDDHIKQQ